MRFLHHFFLAYIIFFTQAYANQVGEQSPKKGKSFREKMAKSLSEAYSARYNSLIRDLNKNRKSLPNLQKLFKGKNKEVYMNFLNRYKVQELPLLEKKGDYYQAKVGEYVFKTSPLDLHKKQFWVNGIAYSYADKKTLNEMVVWLESGTFLKKTSFSNIFMDEAYAGFLVGAIVVVGLFGLLAWGISSLFATVESAENSKVLRNAQKKIKAQRDQCQAALKDIEQGKTSPGVHKDIFQLMKKFDQKFIEDGGFAYFDIEAEFKSTEFKEHLYSNIKGDRNQVIADDCEEFASDMVDGLVGGMLSATRAQENRAVLKEYQCEGKQYQTKVERNGNVGYAYDKEKLTECFQDKVCEVHDDLDSCLAEVWEKHNEMRTNSVDKPRYEKNGSIPYFYDENTGLFGSEKIDGSNANR